MPPPKLPQSAPRAACHQVLAPRPRDCRTVSEGCRRPFDKRREQFVEPALFWACGVLSMSKDRRVETNPEGTTALPGYPRPRPFDRLKDLPRFPPQFVELVETNPEITSAFTPPPL